MNDTEQHEWIKMKEAAKRIGISPAKLSRLAAKGKIETQSDPYDERVKLVDYIALRRIFPER